jgi:MFS family permease
VSGYSDRNRWNALAVLGVAYLMVVLDVSIVNVALPSIQTDLNFAPEDLQWVVSAYALTFGGFLLLGGRAGDLLGRRRLFMIGLGLFAASSLLCGLSQSDTMLIFARGLQGVAGAILSPSVFSIVTVTFEEGPTATRRLASSAASPAPARRSACCSAGYSPSTPAGSGSSSSTSRSGSSRCSWCRASCRKAMWKGFSATSTRSAR